MLLMPPLLRAWVLSMITMLSSVRVAPALRIPPPSVVSAAPFVMVRLLTVIVA